MLCIFSLIYLVFLHLRKHSSILGEMMKTKYDNKVKKLLRDNDDNSMGLWTENHTLMPCEQRTIDRNSQLPVSRCISSLSPAAWSPPNFKWMRSSQKSEVLWYGCWTRSTEKVKFFWHTWPKRCLRNEEWVTTAIHFSGLLLSQSRKRMALALQCSDSSLFKKIERDKLIMWKN